MKRAILIVFISIMGISLYYYFSQTIATLHRLVIEDPLFFSPQIEIEKLQLSISTLSKTEARTRSIIKNEILRSTEYSEDEASSLVLLADNHLFPLTYLQILPQTIQGTATFIKEPSFLHALSMLLIQKTTAAAYRHDAEVLLQAATFLENPRHNFSIELIGSQTDIKTARADFSLVAQNGYALEEEVTDRWECLLFHRCPTHKKFQLPYIPAHHPVAKSNIPEDTFTRSLATHIRGGPYNVYSTCFSDPFISMYLLEGDNYLIPKHAYENYYADFDTLSASNSSAYITAFLSENIPYHREPEGADYRCTDLRYWADLAILDFLHNELGLTNVDSTSDMITTYEEMGSRAERDVLRIIENKMVDMHGFIGTINNHLALFNELLLLNKQKISPEYLLTIRSNYAYLYTTFARSVWRLEIQPKYLKVANTPLPSIYTTYSDLQDSHLKEEIVSFDFPTLHFIVEQQKNSKD